MLRCGGSSHHFAAPSPTRAFSQSGEGYDSVTATQQAYAQIKNVVRENAYIMAFNDAFLVVAGSLLAGAVLVWLCHQAKAVPGAVAH